jgi:hypothetical protein
VDGIVAESQRRVGPTSHKTPFERNLLPSFADWTLEQIEQFKPDFLIPVETKGVHILDAAMAYARETLGRTVTTPVLYASALSYLPREQLRASRAMIIDNAIDTGANARRHIEEIEEHGIADIKTIVCMGRRGREPHGIDVDCYLRVDPDRYMQYLWQLTELVLARGLPPEVDHPVYEIRFKRRFTPAWHQLQALLAGYGLLTVDGPESKRDEIQPVTLHFPRLPGMTRAERSTGGPDKVRFFPDADGERVFVVPISYPPLPIDASDSADGSFTRRHAMRLFRRAVGSRSAAGELLIQRATDPAPVTVFRAMSTDREFKIITGVARLLAASAPGSRLLTHRDVFERVFGAPVGQELAAMISEQLATTLRDHHARRPRLPQPLPAVQAPYVDATVTDTTREIAGRLKQLCEQEPPEAGQLRFGMSMAQLTRELGGDELLASRCVSHGLAMTTLVPFIDYLEHEDGTTSLERQYRVSEPVRAPEPYRDVSFVREEKSEQALAVICRRIRESSTAYKERPLPLWLLTRLVAILRPLVLERYSLRLRAAPAPLEMQLLLLETVQAVTIDLADPSEYLHVSAEGVRPSAAFEEKYSRKELDIDIEGCTEPIENEVDQLIPLIDALDEDELRAVLTGWAMSTDGRLGLTHVRASLRDAITQLRGPLKSILSKEPHERAQQLQTHVDRVVNEAGVRLGLLSTDWASVGAERWTALRGRREQRILASLGTPSEPGRTFEFAGCLAKGILATARLVDLLDYASVTERRAPEDPMPHEHARLVRHRAASAQRALSTLRTDTAAPATSFEAARPEITAAGRDLLALTYRLDALLAALTGTFSGKDLSPRGDQDASARHISIVSLDIADSSAHGAAIAKREHNAWVRAGTDIAAQWARAFGGIERPERNGDEVILEFPEDGDATVLAAAAVLAYTRALRSTEVDALTWRFHAGIACGEVEEEDGDLRGMCVNTAAKVAKSGDGKTEASKVILSDVAADRCSEALREMPLGEPDGEVTLGDHKDRSYKVRTHVVHSAEAMSVYVERLGSLDAILLDGVPAVQEHDRPLRIESAEAEERPQSASDAG